MREISYAHSYRVVRTQASKTLETYLQRIKTLTANYPDTVLPPPSNSSETAAAPRMATAQADDSSWAGWAISSFTKKLNTASGEIERVPTPNAGSSSDVRPTSVPIISASRPSTLAQSRAASASAFDRQTVTSAPKSSFINDDDNEDNDPDAWGDLEEDNFFDAPVEPAKPKTLVPITTAGKTTWDYDDTEPDISAMFSKSKSPLPKGLAKKTPTTAPRIGVGSAFSNGRGNITAARQPAKTAGAFKPIVGTKAKKTETKKVSDPWDNGDDDWGDAWDK